jgi:hypothetical protein
VARARTAFVLGVILGTAIASLLIAKWIVYYLDSIECERLPTIEGLDNQNGPMQLQLDMEV